MKILIVSACLIACVLGQQQAQRRPQPQYDQNSFQAENPQPIQYQSKDQPRFQTTTYIPIIRFDKEQGNDGSYKTSYETGNNIVAEETGFLKTVPPVGDEKEEGHAQVQHGSYSYTSPDGQVITVTYTADEHGFRPSGDHLPTPPPVSPEVQKGLDLIYAGIKAQQEAAARDPERSKDFLNNPGFYRGN